MYEMGGKERMLSHVKTIFQHNDDKIFTVNMGELLKIYKNV